MSQECQQPQAHPARCGCEQQKPYPDRLCHIDYTLHPYHCGCLKGDAEARRRFDAVQRNVSVPATGVEMDNSPDGVKLEVFEIVCKERDRLQAENAALQERLTIADQRVDDLQHQHSQSLEVNPHSLRVVLTALVGAPHEIRELQACRGIPDNPIDQLLREYNAWIETPTPAHHAEDGRPG
jgi:hypothetical protein